MSSENKSCTPKLRFPGFTGEWASKPLSFFLHEHRTKSDGKCDFFMIFSGFVMIIYRLFCNILLKIFL